MTFRKGATGKQIKMPNDAAAILARFAAKRQEHFIVLTLDGGHVVVQGHIVTIGLANRTQVHPREVFYPAIIDNAVGIIIAHNHPSDRAPSPSLEDDGVTQRLVDAGDVLGIPVLDHIIVSRQGYFSYLEHNILPVAK